MVNYMFDFSHMPTVAAVASSQATGTTLPARDHPKTAQKRPILIDIAAIRKRRNSSICTRSKFLIDSKSALLEEQKRTKRETHYRSLPAVSGLSRESARRSRRIAKCIKNRNF